MKKIIIVIFMLCFANCIYAQVKPLDTLKEKQKLINYEYSQLYKENIELSYTSPKGEFGAPSGYVINGRFTTSFMVFAPINLPIAFSINPDYTVRVREEFSAGVRTPSFRFGGTFYVRLAEELKNYKYAQLSFTHHSNGQDALAILPDGNINTTTGNFNTNYLTLAYAFGNFTNTNERTGVYYGYHHKVGLESHRGFNYEAALIGDYGFTRINYDFSLRIYQNYKAKNNIIEKEKWRFIGQLSYAVNKYLKQDFFAPKRRLNVEASANYSLPFMQNVFIMASFGYYGEDPYNIYFKDKYAYMRFGISSTFSRFMVK